MYDTLFSEVEIGAHTVKNRIAFCSPVTGFAKEGQLTTQLAAYYLERAKGGAGLIELEPALVFNKYNVSAWREFAERIHAYGVKLVAAFELPSGQTGMVESCICHGIAVSAKLLSSTGFDGISLYPARHSQAETEPPGGEWITELLQSISHDCGDHFIKGVHLPPPNLTGDHISLRFLKGSGADYLALPDDGGYDDFHAPIPVVKKTCFAEPASCEMLLENGDRDLIGLSRQLICDPYWPLKTELGKEMEIRKHISFEEDDHTSPLDRISCAFNPYLGQESRYSEHNMTPAAKCKNVVIVGGGPAGMQVAITASQRGHRVFLFEKEGELGGRLKSGNHRPSLDWLVEEMKRNQVDARIGVPVTAEHIAAPKPDVVIMAVGGDVSRKPMTSALHKKGIQVIDMNDSGCSIGQSIKKGFNVAIGI